MGSIAVNGQCCIVGSCIEVSRARIQKKLYCSGVSVSLDTAGINKEALCYIGTELAARSSCVIISDVSRKPVS